MGNASKAQVTKQLDFTIPVDYVGGGGELYFNLFFYRSQKRGQECLPAGPSIYLPGTNSQARLNLLLSSRFKAHFPIPSG